MKVRQLRLLFPDHMRPPLPAQGGCCRSAGGFKLWEGATDLSLFLLNQYSLEGSMLTSPTEIAPMLKGKRVLELGCGHGLPGLVAALAGADVHFQVARPSSLPLPMLLRRV